MLFDCELWGVWFMLVGVIYCECVVLILVMLMVVVDEGL